MCFLSVFPQTGPGRPFPEALLDDRKHPLLVLLPLVCGGGCVVLWWEGAVRVKDEASDPRGVISAWGFAV